MEGGSFSGRKVSVYQDPRVRKCSMSIEWLNTACKGGHGERRPQREAEPRHAGCGMLSSGECQASALRAVGASSTGEGTWSECNV